MFRRAKMEDEDKPKGISDDVKTVYPLFPIPAAFIKKETIPSSLFPSANSQLQEPPPTATANKDFDWLENKSFTTDTAKKFVEFQDEVRKLQSNISGHVEKNPVSKADANQLSSDSSLPDYECERRQIIKEKEKKKDRKEKHSREYNERSRHKKDKKEIEHSGITKKDIIVKREQSYNSDESDDKHDYGRKRKKDKRYTSCDESVDRMLKKKKKKHKHKQKKHRKEKEDIKIHKDPKHDLPNLYPSNKIFIEETDDLPPHRAFRLDRCADKNSWTYGSLYKLHVARYKLFHPNYLGLHGRQQIMFGNKSKQKTGKTVSNRYFGKENRNLIRMGAEGLIVSEGGASKGELGVDEQYIKVESSDGPAHEEGCDVREQILDTGTSMYVKGRALTELDKCEEQPYSNSNPSRYKVAEFNRKIRESPNDIQLWLDFVKFQDSIGLDEKYSEKESLVQQDILRHTSRTVLEKKLSILDKALESNPANIDLLLTKLELNSEISDATKISKELEQLLFIHPANTKLWKYYLTFNQSRISVFTVSKVTKYYHKCFKTLFGVLEGRVQTHSVPENLSQEVVEIFLQYCDFLKQTGHKERAVASLQAVLEYNIFCPTSLEGSDMETKMANFEEFWDSGCARLGEPGAHGWTIWSEQRNSGMKQENSCQSEENLEDLEEAIIEKNISKNDKWLEIETLREQHHWLPWKPDLSKGQTDEDCEDVERLVLFDDISQILFTVSRNNHFRIVLNFLSLLGLDVDNGGMSHEKLKSDLFLGESKMSGNENLVCYEGSIETVVHSFIVNMLTLLIKHFTGKEKSDLTLTLIEAQLRKIKTNPSELTKNEKKEMRKVLKNILKEEHNRSDLLIWTAYINLERVLGKIGEAEVMAETALSMNGGKALDTVSTEQAVGLISLFNCYAEMLLKIKQKNPDRLCEKLSPVAMETKKRVLSVFSYLAEGKTFKPKTCEELSSLAVLKTSSRFSKLVECACSELDHLGSMNAYTCTKLRYITWCYSLFSYCKTDLQAGLDVYRQLTSLIKNKINAPYYAELEQQLFQDQLRLILYHMSVFSTPLQILRQCLDAALGKYPGNPIFLALFVDVERKSRISGRFNRWFDRWSRTAMSPVPVVFAVQAQMEFLSSLTDKTAEAGVVSNSGLVHRTRTWLEQAVSQSTLQHCPLLWRLYLKLELQTRSSARLQGVYYRAIQQCPWVKSLYMDGVRMFGSDQLQETVDLMTEKELRVQLPVEELDILIG